MITVEHLTKCYGDFMAVNDLSFEIDEGHVYGFLGPNGAGKSTTMNIMTGCLSATAGHVRIDGYDIFDEADKAKKLIGYLPEQPPLYMNETPVEYLRFVGRAKGLKKPELEQQIEDVIHQTRIEEVKNRLISKLSKGYRQRVGIAQALLGNPKVIILDEPTVGLDPLQIIEIRELIRQLGQSHTVILSSHILSEVQAICDKILIIAKGRLVAFDEPQNLEKLMIAANEISFTAEADKEEVAEILDSMEEITEWEVQEDTAQEEEAQEKGALPETEPEHAEPEKGALQETAPEAVAPEYGGAPETEPQDTESGEGFAQKEETEKTAAEDAVSAGTGLPREVPAAVPEEQSRKEEPLITVHAKIGTEDSRAVCRKLFFAFAAKGRALLEMSSRKASLEDVFIELTESEVSEE